MNKIIKKILKKLNLVFYEYDQNSKIFYCDKIWTKKYYLKEYAKILSVLEKNKINFLSKGEKIKVLKNNFNKKEVKKIKKYYKKKNKKYDDIIVLGDSNNDNIQKFLLFEIVPIEQNIDLKGYEAIIFTSKNAVYSLEKINPNWKKIPTYSVASKTAKAVKELGGKIKYVGFTKHGDEFAKEIAPKLKHKRVLYVRAKKVVSNLKEILISKEINYNELIAYKTIVNKNIDTNKKFPENSIFIFTSPSTVEIFLRNFTWKDTYKAVAIGKTTFKYLPDNFNSFIANDTSVQACINKAISLKE